MTVNNRPVQYLLDPETPLLFALREASNLTGTKFGFGGMLRVQHVDKTAAVYRPVVLGTDDDSAMMAQAAALVEVEEALVNCRD